MQRIESNWRTGRHTLKRIHCRSETSKGVYCLQYDDSKIISGLRDNTIKVGCMHIERWCRNCVLSDILKLESEHSGVYWLSDSCDIYDQILWFIYVTSCYIIVL